MAQPTPDDLLTRILEAFEAGAGCLRALVTQFRVRWGCCKNIRMQQVHCGERWRPEQRRNGPVSRMTAEVERQVRDWVRGRPDLIDVTPGGRWLVLNTLGTMSLAGLEAALTVLSAADGDVI